MDLAHCRWIIRLGADLYKFDQAVDADQADIPREAGAADSSFQSARILTAHHDQDRRMAADRILSLCDQPFPVFVCGFQREGIGIRGLHLDNKLRLPGKPPDAIEPNRIPAALVETTLHFEVEAAPKFINQVL